MSSKTYVIIHDCDDAASCIPCSQIAMSHDEWPTLGADWPSLGGNLAPKPSAAAAAASAQQAARQAAETARLEAEASRRRAESGTEARCLNDAPCPPFTSHGASITQACLVDGSLHLLFCGKWLQR
eukprot:COSAG01_NODE_8869_length_2629_cov_3.546998_3_plen_126_part_00